MRIPRRPVLLCLLGLSALAVVVGFRFLAVRSTLPRVEFVRVVWTFEPPPRGAIISTPLPADDRVYVAAIQDAGFTTSGTVYALDRETGKVVWQFDDGGAMQHMYSTPCLADGRLYVGEGMHANRVCKLYCLDASSGRKLWQFIAGGHIESSPCVADGRVFFGAGDDGLYCLDAVTGKKDWQFLGPYHIDSSPVVVGRWLYAGSGVSRTRTVTEVFCLDAADGGLRWRTAVDLPAWGSPCIEGEDVLVGLGNGRLVRSADPPEKPAGAVVCLDAASGDLRWRHDVPDAVLVRPTVDAHHVYFGARDGLCRCIDRRSGRPCWSADMGSPVLTTPALCDGGVYVVASSGRVCRFDAVTGAVGWTFDVAARSQTRPQLLSSPAVVRHPDGRRIYFGTELRGALSSAAMLYCLED